MILVERRERAEQAVDRTGPPRRGALPVAAIMGSADAVVSNMRRAALARLGLDPDAVRARFPRLIYCVANGYGSDGPYADHPAYDDAIQASSGLAWLIGQVSGSSVPSTNEMRWYGRRGPSGSGLGAALFTKCDRSRLRPHAPV